MWKGVVVKGWSQQSWNMSIENLINYLIKTVINKINIELRDLKRCNHWKSMIVWKCMFVQNEEARFMKGFVWWWRDMRIGLMFLLKKDIKLDAWIGSKVFLVSRLMQQ